ncbi:hypothetical protein SAY87_004958 [Trapa incisa]|uniref:Exocyst subunit Exo70 family protein n=1 Tax=Trapa incisa TaxID=236973 RepID=A0AAN7JQ20_9MYRT|nr:hypothetical protein SAY87_004958 [Trapa incisa]
MEKAPPEISDSFARDDQADDSDPSLAAPAAPPPESPMAEPKVEEDETSTVLEKSSEPEKEGANEAEEAGLEGNPPADDAAALEEKEKENGDGQAHGSDDDDAVHRFDQVMEDIDDLISFLAAANAEEEATSASLEGHHNRSVQRLLGLVQARALNYITDSPEAKSTWGQCPDDDSSFLQAVGRVSKLYSSFNPSKWAESSGNLINQVTRIHHRAMTFLEDEFRSLLEDCKPIIASEGDNADGDKYNTPPPEQEESPDRDYGQITDKDSDNSLRYPQEIVSNLSKIAREMILGHYETECYQVYVLMRRNTIGELLGRTGFEGISIDDVQKMPWETLQREIPKWVEAFQQSAKVCFPSELKLIDGIFEGKSEASAFLFHSLTLGVMVQLLNFSEAVAMSKRAPEKLFKFLDMYEAMRDMEPVLTGLLGECKEHEFIKSEMVTARSRLGESTVNIFCDLENSVGSDTGKNVVPGGAIHPLTRYIMNYLELTCEYKETLEQVFRDHLRIERADSNNRSEFQGGEGYGNYADPNENHSQFSIQIGKIMALLDKNLEAKSKLYRDTALSSIFMMNNGRYILQKVKGSREINMLMGDNWRRKKSSDLRQCHKTYQRETWNKVLGCLRDDHGLTVNGKVVKPELKERFKSFNAMFDEIHKTQSLWVVCDEQLQSELRVSISAVVIPAYRSFLGRFSQTFTPGRQTEKYVKYQSEDLETYIDELFDGKKKP